VEILKSGHKKLAYADSIGEKSKEINKQKKITDTIFKLEKVKQRSNYIDQQTKGKRHLQLWIAETPKLNQPYYYIQVGEDNGTNFVTHFNFNIYPDSMRIMFYDIRTEKEITL
jgi:hypothetical protein